MKEGLLYRRQFFLGFDWLDDSKDSFKTWKRQEIATRYRLSVHPDLALTHVEQGTKSLTLLGYVLDPDNVTANNQQILEALCARFEKSSDVPLLTSRLGGRWVIVAHDGTSTVVFHDAGGLRQVYYAEVPGSNGPNGPNGKQTVCASQPKLLSETFNLPINPDALDYLKAWGNDDYDVYWMPGDRSQYTSVRALLPNHVLELSKGMATRYWPTAGGHRVRSLPYEMGLNESVKLLRGLRDSAQRRYPLAVAMTAGWDSRLALALGREAAKAKDLYCYTMTYPNVSTQTRDVYVPARLLDRLGIPHHVLSYPDNVDEAFRAIAKRTSSSIHSAYCADVQALFEAYPAERLCITGDVAEVVKAHFRVSDRASTSTSSSSSDVSAADLVKVSKVHSHPFVLAAFDEWLSGAPKPDDLQGIHLLDLCCWEQMAGRWHAQIRTEYDIAQESFAPLNCRSLLITMLGVDEHRRVGPRFDLLKGIIEALWADLLLVPINPRERIRLRRMVRSVLGPLVPRAMKDFGKRIVGRIP